jgi:hypothetical protein
MQDGDKRNSFHRMRPFVTVKAFQIPSKVATLLARLIPQTSKTDAWKL